MGEMTIRFLNVIALIVSGDKSFDIIGISYSEGLMIGEKLIIWFI
jgi:hypothetical protein